jgi:hypothetical protein
MIVSTDKSFQKIWTIFLKGAEWIFGSAPLSLLATLLTGPMRAPMNHFV